MRKINWGALILAVVMLMSLTACTKDAKPKEKDSQASASEGEIYLYGEAHGEVAIMEKEFELWNDYYHNDGMRHLFIENSYYGAQFLNIWMHEDNDDILNTLYDDWEGTQGHVPATKNFFKQIKEHCPETIFHGTDIGFQYNTIGERYLKYLEQNDLEDSEQYTLAKENIEQVLEYYKKQDDVYRENTMVKNFIREFDTLEGESVMGIYGGAHTILDGLDYSTQTVPCMANQLKERYGDIIHSESLTWTSLYIEPSRVDTIELDGKSYEASYFGQYDWNGIDDYANWQYWRLESAYEDFKDNPKTGETLLHGYYPLLIEDSRVYIIDMTKTDGSVTRKYYRSDGLVDAGRTVTEEFQIDTP